MAPADSREDPALNILHLCSARDFVGEAAHVIDLAESQIAAGHQVTLVARAGYAVAAEAERRSLPLQVAGLHSRFNPIRDYADVRRLRRLLAAREIGVVHAHRSKEHWLAAWALRGFRRKLPLIRTRHVVTPLRNHCANRWLYTRATAGVICPSEAVRAQVAASLPLADGRLRVIPGCTRLTKAEPPEAAAVTALRQRLELAGASRVVTMLGRTNPVKGHVFAIDAMPEVLERHPATVFVFAYPRHSTYKLDFEERIRGLGVQSQTRWLDKQDSIAPLLALTDIGLVASVGSEGWSRAAAEYLVTGIPVVGTSVGSVPEIVRDNATGIIVPPRDAAALAAALIKLLDDNELRAKLGRRAKEEADRFSPIRMAKEVSGFYEEAGA